MGYHVAGVPCRFRDQLQDGMALAVSRLALTREHVLRAAAHQFSAGDVQRWWLPNSGQGVRKARTKASGSLARYEIVVENARGIGRGIAGAALDGVPVPERPLQIALADDGKIHELRVTLG